MGIQKNFRIANGLEVNDNLIFADKDQNTVGIGTTITPEKLQVNGGIGATSLVLSGVGTIPTLKSTTANINTGNINVGVVTSISGIGLTYTTGNFTNLNSSSENISGIATVGSLYISSNQVISLGRQLQNIVSLDSTTASTIQNSITFGETFANLQITGIATIGTVEINSGIITSTTGILTYYGDAQYLQNVPAGSPSGSNTQVQYNNSGSFAGSSNFIFDGTNVVVGSAVTINSTGINVSSGIITASTFAGDLSGNATTANSATTATSSITSTNANNINVSDESIDTTCFPVFTTSATGNQAPKTDASSLTYNALSGTLSASTFAGDLSGNATTSTNANNINISAITSTDTTTSVVLVGNQSTGYQSPFIDSGLTYDANANTLTATTFVGNLTGNATTANSATTATNANNINVSDEGVDTTCFPVFTTSATGNQAPKTDASSLTYDSFTGTLSSTNLNSTSDINLKKDIEIISNSRQLLNQINGVRFSWKETNQKSLGVIAQEIEKVFPELISERSDNGIKSVNYNGIIGVLIEAVKELSKEVEDLKKKL